MSDDAYENIGEIPIDGADDANIPVDIWLSKTGPGGGEDGDDWDGEWHLYADNYMPRKGCLSGEGIYHATSRDRAVLVKLVQDYWLPLYKKAVHKLSNFEVETRLYYWS